MTIGVAEAQRVAALAELAVPDAELPQLAAQLERIVAFVAQLDALDLPADAAPVQVGPAQTPLRADEPGAVPLAHGPEAIAPAFEEGFFVVPKLGGLADG